MAALDDASNILVTAKNMVQDTDEQSQGQSRIGCRSLRSYVIFMVLLVLFLFYYIIPNEISNTWTSKVGLFVAETFASKTSNSTLNTTLSETTAEPWKPPEPYHVAYPYKYSFVLNEPEKCQKENTFVALIVPVAPSNIAARDAVRSTWGSEKLVGDKIVSLLFLLGLPTSEDSEKLQEDVLQESEKYHDLLQSNFWDSYHNLTIKTMVMLEWLTSYCQNASYAMKVDSDIFLNVKNLVNLLLSAPKKNYMTGLVARGAVVLRNPHSKWYLPKTAYAPDFYPPYALGLGYVFSTDLPEKLVGAARHVKPVYIEDVFLGLCMNHLGIPMTNPPNGILFNVFPVAYTRCTYSKLIATTTHSLKDQVEFWKDLQTHGPEC